MQILTLAKLIFISLLIFPGLQAQTSEIKTRIDMGELLMTFPSIYFKHNSTDYAKMPYTVDSCLKHIANNIKDVTGKPIWRDSAEVEGLTRDRIKKIKEDLSKYTTKKLSITSMKNAQKLSRRTISLASDTSQASYLLSLNSVFDIAKTRFPKTYRHGLWVFGTCFKCIFNNIFVEGHWLNKNGREHCRIDQRSRRKYANDK